MNVFSMSIYCLLSTVFFSFSAIIDFCGVSLTFLFVFFLRLRDSWLMIFSRQTLLSRLTADVIMSCWSLSCLRLKRFMTLDWARCLLSWDLFKYSSFYLLAMLKSFWFFWVRVWLWISSSRFFFSVLIDSAMRWFTTRCLTTLIVFELCDDIWSSLVYWIEMACDERNRCESWMLDLRYSDSAVASQLWVLSLRLKIAERIRNDSLGIIWVLGILTLYWSPSMIVSSVFISSVWFYRSRRVLMSVILVELFITAGAI